MPKMILSALVGVYLLLFFSGCGSDEETASSTPSSGWHFQGRNCLACHNQNLQADRHLIYGGTVYRSSSAIVDKEDLSQVCGGVSIELWDSSHTTRLYRFGDYNDTNSKGYLGKGNVFILKRMLSSITSQNYGIDIVDHNGVILAQVLHQLSGADYDPNYPQDYSNRISCNACHSNNVAPIYVDAAKIAYCQ